MRRADAALRAPGGADGPAEVPAVQLPRGARVGRPLRRGGELLADLERALAPVLGCPEALRRALAGVQARD